MNENNTLDSYRQVKAQKSKVLFSSVFKTVEELMIAVLYLGVPDFDPLVEFFAHTRCVVLTDIPTSE